MYEIASRYLGPQAIRSGERWFSDERHDLFVWCDPDGTITQFHFCYGKGTAREQIVRWHRGYSPCHDRIDDGDRPMGKMTPILVPNGKWEPREVCSIFLKVAGELPEAIRTQIVAAILNESQEPSHP